MPTPRKNSRDYAQVLHGYFKHVLRPHLLSLRLSDVLLLRVEDDITQRFLSVLSAWPDAEFRRTVLLLAEENTVGFSPHSVRREIHAFVAVAVRNSILEELHTTKPYDPSFSQTRARLTDKDVSSVTHSSALYLDEAFRDGVCSVPAQPKDLFRGIAARHPTAWSRLSLIANSKCHEEFPSECDIPEALPAPAPSDPSDNTAIRDVVSGYDPTIGPALEEAIRYVAMSKGMLPVASFKMLSRNPEKLVAVIDRLLLARCLFVTNNYVIGPAYCARRKPLQQPAHDLHHPQKLFSPDGTVSETHRVLLRRALTCQ